MEDLKKMFGRFCDAATFPIVCLGLWMLSGCASNNSPVAPQAPPLTAMSGLPAQPPQVVNLNQQLLGQWSATYPGGPFRVAIETDPLLGGTNYIATMVDGGYGTFHPGSIVFKGTPDQAVTSLVVGSQKCSDPGYISATDVSMTITVLDANDFTEELVNKNSCKGFPVKFTRSASSSSP
jgi:hypothetical protein